MRAAYIYDESDVQGPRLMLCEPCLRATREDWEFDGGIDGLEWIDTSDRCACCGATENGPDDLVLCESDQGDGWWTLHAPGSTDEEIASGDAPALYCGNGKCTTRHRELATGVLESRQ